MYKQLTSEERYYIATYLRQGLSKNQIAKQLNRSHTPVLREISRNTGGSGYRYKQEHAFAGQRHGTKNKATKLNDSIKKLIAKYIKLDWSPEQVCGRLSRDNIINLHHETVYRYILKNKQHNGKLYKHLRHQVKAYRKRYGYPNNRGAIPNRPDIDQRPWAVIKTANGLLRQYFLKKTPLKDVSYARVKVATDKLNSRPRKCLSYRTPFEVLYSMTGIDVSQLEVVHL